MGADGVVIIKGAQGITGTPKAATFTVGIILVLITLFIVLNLDQFPYRTRYHVHP